MLASSGKRAKIVCTLGPSTSTAGMIRAIAKAGMDVARLNFSHGDHTFHTRLFNLVRETAKQTGCNLAVMQDLQGPKLRAGKLPPAGIDLVAGDVVLLYPDGSEPKISTHGKKLLPISPEIADPISRDTQKGNRILFDDGKICTVIREVSPPEIVVEVAVGGRLTSHKGMNLPGTPLSIPCMTEKDYRDLKLGLSLGVDAVALSFVRSPTDIEEVRNFIRRESNSSPLVISKIEREEAVARQEEIIEVSDALLIARGDMAVELGAGRVPVIQKELIHACSQLGVPIITATQMLESMISSPTPTRAEASDVANAIFDGTDAVMLSAETASGQYPVEAVKTMVQVILEAEKVGSRYSTHPNVLPLPGSVVDSVQFSAGRIAHHTGARLIACITRSGVAAKTLAKYRPDKPIAAIMDQDEPLRKLAFVWGVRGIMIPAVVATDDLWGMVDRVVVQHRWAEKGDVIVITAGVPTLQKGTTNTIKVHRVSSSAPRSS